METSASQHLSALASTVAAAYVSRPDLNAIVVVGSVARGWADAWSDVEILLCWQAVPGVAAREHLAQAAGAGALRTFPADPELAITEESFVRDGAKVDLLHAAVRDIDALLDAVTQGSDPSVRRQVVVAALRDGIALKGGSRLAAWQERAAIYPPALQVAMVERYLVFGPHEWLRMLAHRNDVLALAQVRSRIAEALLGIVLALNRTYPVSNDGKWALRMAQPARIAPTGFATRLERLLTAAPEEAVDIATVLIDETLDLVARHLGGDAVDRARRRVLTTRAR